MHEALTTNFFIESTNTLNSLLQTYTNNMDYRDLEQKFPGFSDKMHSLCVHYIKEYFKPYLSGNENSIITKENLMSMLPITKNNKLLFNYMLDVLEKNKLLNINGENIDWHSNIKIDHDSLSYHYHLEETYPMFSGTLSLLQHCMQHYPAALSGKILPLSVLYPEGNTHFLDQSYARDSAQYTEMPILIDIIIKLISTLNNKQPLKILEIGGGRGMLAKELFTQVNCRNLQYHFTDIGRRFIINMQRYAKTYNLDFVRTQQFDITKSPIDQGLQLQSYDIIIGLDVIHTTQNVRNSLANIRPLLKNGGLLAMLETTKTHIWHNLIMGLTKGWWLFNDTYRQSTPLLSRDRWQDALKNAGYENIKSFELNNNSDATLLISGNS